ncbi:hypothetical protein GDO86_018151 [Hymenochirus boettgeri]|uniref:Uncharacterized protein n=1 Tax=Hymenochirus boettgeri TaxID=247094 RepID=A0A8T2IEG3_9PIPI|nr:hypothetical protein GDO86_018151 [Hymenochirus boettgeri]
MGTFLILTLVLSVLFFVLLFTSIRRQQKRSQLLPRGPTPLPLLGNVTCFGSRGAMKCFPEFHRKYGKMFTVWLGTEPVVVLCGYDVVKDALVNHAEQFSGRPMYPVMHELTEGFSFISEGEHWRLFRRFLMSTLRNVGMGKKILEDRCLMEAEQLIEAMAETGGKPFNPIHLLSCAVANIISFTLFGQYFDYKDKKLQVLITNTRKNVINLFSIKSQICNIFPILLKLPFVLETMCKNSLYIQDYVKDQISFHKETLDTSNPRDFTDYFLLKIKEEKRAGDSPFCDTSLLMYITGILTAEIDTTSSTLKYCLSLIAQLHTFR